MSVLTRIQIGKRQALSLGITDSYAWHQKLWEGFPDKDGERRNFLFRVDDDRQSCTIHLLSPEEPEPAAWGYWESKPIADAFLQHQRYAFELRANPVKRAKDAGGKRVPLIDETDLQDWINRKAESAGCQLEGIDIGPPTRQVFHKPNAKGKPPRTYHMSVDFRGALQVANRDRFTKAFHQGIGPAKAFGFGLLMLQPIS